jgi:ribosomal protein L9
VNSFNETYSHRKIKPALKALQANQSAYSHMRERLKDLEQKLNSSRATAEKKKAALEKAQRRLITSNRGSASGGADCE